MRDQAQGLRALADQARRNDELEHSIPASECRIARTIAITSGKGGVGKTFFSTNLALLLAKNGARVVVLDADLGLANIHVMLGVAPTYTLEHVMIGEKSLQEIMYPGPAGIKIIAGASGVDSLANLDSVLRNRFIDNLGELESLADVILIDTGAGLSRNVLAFVLAASEVVVLTTPEPTALTDAYATIKVVSRENSGARLRLVVNMPSSETEAKSAADRLVMVCKQFLNIRLESLGYIPQDSHVPRSVRAQQPSSLSNPNSPSSRALARIARRLGFEAGAPSNSAGFVHRMTKVLGLSNGA